MRSVVARYEAERMPSRQSTVRVYRSFLNNHVLPKWADTRIQEIQPRPVELWLRELPLSPKSKTHVRSLMHGLVEFAMWSGLLDISRNPVSLVRNIGATRKVRKARSLTAEQFHALLKELQEPFGTMALLSVCLGLRILAGLTAECPARHCGAGRGRCEDGRLCPNLQSHQRNAGAPEVLQAAVRLFGR